MQMFDQVKGYATYAKALKKLETCCNLDTERWMIIANSHGRFVPTVMLRNGENSHMAARGICVAG